MFSNSFEIDSLYVGKGKVKLCNTVENEALFLTHGLTNDGKREIVHILPYLFKIGLFQDTG